MAANPQTKAANLDCEVKVSTVRIDRHHLLLLLSWYSFCHAVSRTVARVSPVVKVKDG